MHEAAYAPAAANAASAAPATRLLNGIPVISSWLLPIGSADSMPRTSTIISQWVAEQ